jgi:NAD+ synthase (glutamine-hydrolysing)
VDRNPFAGKSLASTSECALQIQSHGLARRLSHTRAKCAVIGISGGLDSTLALLVAVRAMDILGRPHSDIEAITMPCFGTTDRTKSNAVTLCEQLGVRLSEINIAASVRQHFADIGHDEHQYDVTYENAQARERTQVLMDIANQKNGLVIGTGDLSELALGWATYNGDHMSMYAVNAGVPKTMVRTLVRYEAERADEPLARVLADILDTPVSPELLPADAQGNIAQKTEDLVGPYELHDFFLYHVMRWGEAPEKIFRLARIAFAGEYDDATILHWLRVFHRRFFNQQFKRSCMPDGPKVFPISLSPRGDWHMPSDASSRLWLEQIDALTAQRS